MRRLLGAVTVICLPVAAMAQSAGKCDRAAFVAVVSDASAKLNAMNDQNKASFHAKLQTLKSRSRWSDADYLTKATPFVKDDTIAAFDGGAKMLLAKVDGLGGAAPVTAQLVASIPGDEESRRCAMLADLSKLMTQIIDNNRAKWTYMQGKVDTAMAATLQAKATH